MQRMVKYTFDSDSDGTATISIKIPGTFAGLKRPDMGSGGRLFIGAELFCKAPLAGDYITNLQVQDIDTVIPALAQAALPNYPAVSLWADPGLDASNVGKYLNPNGINYLTPINMSPFCPSGLYLTATVQKATKTVDTIYLNIIWDDLT